MSIDPADLEISGRAVMALKGLALVTLAAAVAAKPTLYDMKAWTTDGKMMDLAEVADAPCSAQRSYCEAVL